MGRILFTLPARAEIEGRILLTFFDKKKSVRAGFYVCKGRAVIYTQPNLKQKSFQIS
jgi:hypothetical protein